VLCVAALVTVGAATGAWADWWYQFESEYWNDLVEPGRRVSGWPMLMKAGLMTGLLPVVALWSWRRLSLGARTLWLTAAAYLAVVLAGSYKNLHYLAPLPWLFVLPAVEGSSRRGLAGGTLLVAGVCVWSLPDSIAIRREPIELGRQTCISGLSAEQAALVSGRLYDVLDWPVTGRRFGVGKHTFVRYGLSLGGTHCAIGLAPAAPSGAVVLDDRGAAQIWTTDVDGFARWRLSPAMSMPSARLFPRLAPATVTADLHAWLGRQDLRTEPASALVIEAGRRWLGPVSDHGAVTLGLSQPPHDVVVRINGLSARAIVEPDGAAMSVVGPWRRGWNILELQGRGVDVEWLDGTSEQR
jgi:hypothetical protein